MLAITATDPTTGQPIYLSLERDGTPVCSADVNQAATWHDVKEMLAWFDGLPESTQTRIVARGPKVVEVTGPTLEPGVTQADLQVSMERSTIQRSARLPRKQRRAS